MGYSQAHKAKSRQRILSLAAKQIKERVTCAAVFTVAVLIRIGRQLPPVSQALFQSPARYR